MKVYKHTFQIVVLSECEDFEQLLGDEYSLADIDYLISQGSAIGQFEHQSTKLVKNYKKELIKIGNDGSFFDSFQQDE